MRALVQRVKEGAVTIDGHEHARIGKGLVILLGVKRGDTKDAAGYLAAKCAALRVFEDDGGKMNVSTDDAGGEALVISQFTLYADARRGTRPGFTEAAPPDEAEPLYAHFAAELSRLLGTDRVKTGVFGAMMDVMILNDGPVTILIDSPTTHTT